MKTETERHMLPRSTNLGMTAAAALTVMAAAAVPAQADPMLFIGLQQDGVEAVGGGSQRSCAPAASDRLAPKRSARRPAARQRPRPDAEKFGGEVSFEPPFPFRSLNAVFPSKGGRIPFVSTSVAGFNYSRRQL